MPFLQLDIIGVCVCVRERERERERDRRERPRISDRAEKLSESCVDVKAGKSLPFIALSRLNRAREIERAAIVRNGTT